MTDCNPKNKFIITSDGYIELRTKEGQMLSSICCKKCLPQLETIIKKFKNQNKRR